MTLCIITGCFNAAQGQVNTSSKPKLVLIEVDTKDYPHPQGKQAYRASTTEIIRLELDKLSLYNVVNKYDLEYLMKRDSLSFANCFSSYCIAEVAEKMECDKVLTGSISMVGEKIVIVFKLYNAETKQFDKQIVKEFLDLPLQLTSMIRFTLRELHSLPIDNESEKSITEKFQFDEVKNNPYKALLRSDGPRMGLTYFMDGRTTEILQNQKSRGGFNANPYMFQFGYQFEKQYLNEGNFQALFEFLPMVTGLDQGMIIPSFTIMNGLRSNKNGWEFAFGPSFSLTKQAKGFYGTNNEWKLEEDTVGLGFSPSFEYRLDSRGEVRIHPSFIFAVGKTVKSGKLNVPINAYFIPNKEGLRFGLSFGFNSRARYENK